MWSVVAFLGVLGLWSALVRKLRSGTNGLAQVSSKTYEKLSGGLTAYSLQGNPSAELVVCVHGYSSGMTVWTSMVAFLVSKGYRVLCYDLHGRGHSHSHDVPHTLPFFVRQLEELLHRLKLDTEPFNLIGLSMGGVIVSEYTRLHGELVKRLAMLAPAGLPTRKPAVSRALVLPVLRDILMFHLGKPILAKQLQRQLVRARSIGHEALTNTEVVSQAVTEQLNSNPVFLRSLLSTLVHFELDHQSALFRTVGTMDDKRPVLLVWGDQDELCPYANCATLCRLIPQSQVLTIPTGSHMSILEHASAVNHAVLQFVRTSKLHPATGAGTSSTAAAQPSAAPL